MKRVIIIREDYFNYLEDAVNRELKSLGHGARVVNFCKDGGSYMAMIEYDV